MTDATQRLASRYNAAAHAYQQLWASALLPHGRHLVSQMALSDATCVLDIATGVGTLLSEIQRAAPHAKVLGVDIAPGMLALAPREFDTAVMDAAQLEFPAATFDGAVMAFALFLMPDPLAALVEARRILRAGGMLGIASWVGEPTYPALDIWFEECRAAGATPSAWSADAIDPHRLRALLLRAGFDAVRIWTGRFDYASEPSTFLELRTGMAAQWLSTLTENVREAMLGRLRTRLSVLPTDAFIDPTPVLYAIATATQPDPLPTACS